MQKKFTYIYSTLLCLLLLTATSYPAANPARFDPLLKSNWYGLYMQGAKIGYVMTSLEKISRPVDGWKSQTQLTIKMKMADQEVTMTTGDTRIYKSPGGELYENHLNVAGPTGDIEVAGKIKDDKYAIETQIGGEKKLKEFSYPVDFLDSVLCVDTKIISGRAAVGDSFTFSSFEPTPPLTGIIHQTAKIESQETYVFNGVPTDIFVVNSFIKEMNLLSQGRVDLFGNVLEGSLGAGMVIKLEGEAQAKRLDDSYDILKSSIVPGGRQLDDPSRLKSLKLKIRGIDTTEILSTSMQTVNPDDSVLNVAINAQETPANTIARPIATTEYATYLASDPMEQSDDPQIIKLADSIVNSERDSWIAAKKINLWVYENIKKKFSPDFSNALQTLNSRVGDCGEHTALAVALLRAAGIPARPVVGLVYWPPGNGFGYHAWTEVYVGRWVQMDPTWGEDLADPAHIALARGDIIAQVGVLHKVMGKIKIEIVDAQ